MSVAATIDAGALANLLRDHRPKGCERETLATRADVRAWAKINVSGGVLTLSAVTLNKQGYEVAPDPAAKPGSMPIAQRSPTDSGAFEVPYGVLERVAKALAQSDAGEVSFFLGADCLTLACDGMKFRIITGRVAGKMEPTIARSRFGDDLLPIPPAPKPKVTWMHGKKPAPVAPVETPAPAVVVPTPAPVKETPMPTPAPVPTKPAPARVHAPSAKRPPDGPATLSPAARSIVAALGKLGGKGDKRALIGAGADRAEWSTGLSEAYRAKLIRRVPGAEVVHTLA